MANQRSVALREELERLLANNSLSLLGAETRTIGQEETTRQQQHQTIQEERATLFRPSVRPRNSPAGITAAVPGPSTSASASSYSSSRSYGPAARGRGRSSRPVSWSRRSTPYGPARQQREPPSKKKIISKDIYLMDVDVIEVPRGPKRVMLFDNKQVRTAVQLDIDDGAAVFCQKIEEEFKDIIDFSKPSPQ